MFVTAEFTIRPIGTEASTDRHVVACERVLRDQGFEPQLHAWGVGIEGEWGTVMAAVRRCHDRVHELGAVRAMTELRIGTRTDREEHLDEMIDRVRAQETIDPA